MLCLYLLVGIDLCAECFSFRSGGRGVLVGGLEASGDRGEGGGLLLGFNLAGLKLHLQAVELGACGCSDFTSVFHLSHCQGEGLGVVLHFEFASFESDAQGRELGLGGGTFNVGLFGFFSAFDCGITVRYGFSADLSAFEFSSHCVESIVKITLLASSIIFLISFARDSKCCFICCYELDRFDTSDLELHTIIIASVAFMAISEGPLNDVSMPRPGEVLADGRLIPDGEPIPDGMFIPENMPIPNGIFMKLGMLPFPKSGNVCLESIYLL